MNMKVHFLDYDTNHLPAGKSHRDKRAADSKRLERYFQL